MLAHAAGTPHCYNKAAWCELMPTLRPKRKKPAPHTLASKELARHTQEHLALAKELVDLAHELCAVAWELQKITRASFLVPTEP